MSVSHWFIKLSKNQPILAISTDECATELLWCRWQAVTLPHTGGRYGSSCLYTTLRFHSKPSWQWSWQTTNVHKWHMLLQIAAQGIASDSDIGRMGSSSSDDEVSASSIRVANPYPRVDPLFLHKTCRNHRGSTAVQSLLCKKAISYWPVSVCNTTTWR